MAQPDRRMRHKVAPRRRHVGLVAMLALAAACDSTSPGQRSHDTIAVLSAVAAFNDVSTGDQHYCTLSGNWSLPAWPTSTATDSATLYFARELLLTGGTVVRRDTTLPNVSITWTPVDSTHLDLVIGPPLTAGLTGSLDSATGRVFTASWPCSPSLPFGSDSALLANGYQPDSLGMGLLHVSRVTPID
jgi:hypothetical protein